VFRAWRGFKLNYLLGLSLLGAVEIHVPDRCHGNCNCRGAVCVHESGCALLNEWVRIEVTGLPGAQHQMWDDLKGGQNYLILWLERKKPSAVYHSRWLWPRPKGLSPFSLHLSGTLLRQAVCGPFSLQSLSLVIEAPTFIHVVVEWKVRQCTVENYLGVTYVVQSQRIREF